MLTELRADIRATPDGRTADRILRSCVHCGFCLATCPTYRLLGDELDSPRGRIYLIKSALEGKPAGRETQLHLDRCLTCRACESTCPSGVEYGRLLEIGRAAVEAETARPLWERLQRGLLLRVLPYRRRFTPLLRLAQAVRPLLPAALRQQVPVRTQAGLRPSRQHQRRVILFEGCVQPALAPSINAAAARIFDQLSISCEQVPGEGCCGALSLHLGRNQAAQDFARRNIDRWLPLIESGVEAIIVTASGCGVTVKDYDALLRDDPEYADKAAHVAALVRDPGEYLMAEDLSALARAGARVAFQSPCTLQHGQSLAGVTERLLQQLDFELTPQSDSHQCCGSAGTYSILKPQLARQLRQKKLASLEKGKPDMILTANIGCLLHLQQTASVPVRHWLEVIDVMNQ